MATLNKLRFDMNLVEHPYPTEADAHLQAWVNISISCFVKGQVVPFNMEKRVPLFETQWDLVELAEWFVLSQDFLCDTTLPASEGYPSLVPGESLAQAIRRLARRDFTEMEGDAQELWFNTLLNFRTHHALRFALRGARLPDIIIGCNQGVGEISLAKQEEDDDITDDWSYLGAWAFPFDMDDFIVDLRQKLRNLLAQWSAPKQDSGITARVDNIIRFLEQCPS